MTDQVQEGDLRLRAERLARRSQIVAETARELARVGLRAGPVLEALARRVAQALQGACIVTIHAEDTGALEVVATHHPSAEADALLSSTVNGAIAPTVAGSPVSRAFEDGEAALFASVTPVQLERFVRSRPSLAPYYARFGLSSFVIAPLRVPGKVLGTIGCSRHTGAPPLDQDDLAFLSKLGDLASLALENARLHSLAEDSAERSQVVAELSRALAGARLSPPALLDQVARRLSEVLRGCVVVRLGRSTGGRHDEAEPAAWHGPTDDARALLQRLSPSFGSFPRGPAARAAFDEDGPLLFSATSGAEQRERLRAVGLEWLVDLPGVTAILVAPLMTRGELAGIVAVWRDRDGRPFVGRDRDFVQKTADVAALALENVRLLRAAEAERAHLVVILQQLPVGVVITDPSGRLAMANEQTGLVLGRTPVDGDLIDVDPTGGAREGPLARALRSGEVVKDEMAEVTRDDGTETALRVSAAPVREPGGRVVAGVLTLADVSERVRLERELRRRAEELAEAHERKDQFLAMLAHELRAPLAPILTATHLLQHPGASAQALARATGVIDRQVHHLARLVDDLLEVSRITRGKIRMERLVTDAAAVVARALETSRPAIQAKAHALEVTLAPERLPLEADPVRLSQVLSNLLQNAAKYTDPGGRITLEARREGHEVVFRVRDSGIGIPPDQLESIFELFAQVDRSLDRSQGGLGIGLTLARALVELHGGTIQARSPGIGRGAELVVRLPAHEPRSVQVDAQGGPDAGPAARPRRVLVVDDSRDAVEMLADLLGSWGHEVAVAGDGVEALERAADFVPEVVLLDIGLPRLDGYEVARRLRSARVEPAPLLVAVTGYGQEEDRRRASDAGFDGLLVKPVAVRDLRDVIDRGIDKRRTSGQQRRSSP